MERSANLSQGFHVHHHLFYLDVESFGDLGYLEDQENFMASSKMFLISSCCGLVTGLTQPYFAVSEFLPQNCVHTIT